VPVLKENRYAFALKFDEYKSNVPLKFIDNVLIHVSYTFDKFVCSKLTAVRNSVIVSSLSCSQF